MPNGPQTANCAYCGEPLPVWRGHVLSWRIGSRYACNEFCAEGVEEGGQAAARGAPRFAAAA
jgi:hypothetical protein